MFTWIPIYKEIANKLLEFEKKQSELINILDDIKAKGIPAISTNDIDKDDKRTRLQEIDPFTFIANFNRGIKDKNRKDILQYLKKLWNLEAEIPSDFLGIPVVNNQSSWFFAYKKKRKTGDVQLLWDIFKEVISDSLKEDTFNKTLKIERVNKNLTMGLFWIVPEKYINIDKVNEAYFHEKGITAKFKDYGSYMQIVNEVSNKIEKEFYEISYDAWKYSQSKPDKEEIEIERDISDIRFWICAPGTKAKFWDECKKKNELYFGADELPNLLTFKNRDEIADKLREVSEDNKSHKNDSLACWQFSREIKEGDIIIPKKGVDTYLGYGVVIGQYRYDESRESYRNIIPVEWKKTGEFKETKHAIVQKTLTDITSYTDYVRRLRELIGIEFDIDTSIDNELEVMPLNCILYGPPGTGKTHKIQTKYMPLFTTKKKMKSKEEYLLEVMETQTWFSSAALAMLDYESIKVPDLAKTDIMKIKAALSNNKNVNAAIWAHLQMHTKPDCEAVNYSKQYEPAIFWKNDDSTWTVDKELVKEMLPELYSTWETLKSYKPEEMEEKRYEFITFHQSFSYEDFIEGIKPVLDDEAENKELDYQIEDGIFKKMVKKALLNPEKKWALFIDEINRGNIAGIFGELITLIEKDKRNKLTSILPYSKKDFTVPDNLYIIGTMNTADRSIEALDSALRRRFSFIEVVPDSSLLNQPENSVEGIDFEALLDAVNSRINVLLDKDHMIGHSYFLNLKDRSNPLDDLKEIFSTKIIPLLEEYFYGDRSKIKMVLGPAFVEEKPIENIQFFELENTKGAQVLEDEYIYNIKIPDTIEGFISIYE